MEGADRMRDEAPKLEGSFHLDLDFGEALARFAQTKPEEVEPPKGRPRKDGKPAVGDVSQSRRQQQTDAKTARKADPSVV